MKIVWLDLNSSYSHSSLALPALHAQLDGDGGWEWEVVAATINDNPGDVAAKVASFLPDVVASTCWLFSREHLTAVFARCAVLLPDAAFIAGGPEFLGDNEVFLRTNPFFDCVLRGEGEEVFGLWLSRWNRRDLWRDIPGLCYIDTGKPGLCRTDSDVYDAGEYIDNGLARVADIEKLRSPQESRFFNWTKPFVQFETTRGCFNTCAFCVSGGEKPVRVLSLQTVRKRLQQIHSKGIRDVRMLDRTFNYDTDRALGMLGLFEEFYPDMHFHLEVHPALIAPALREKLAQMPPDLLHIEAGIQSLHSDVLALSGRRGSLEASLDGLRFLASSDNIVVHADLIAGLPGYGLQAVFEDVVTLAEIGVGEIQLESLKVLPGTVMRRNAGLLGLKYSPLPPYEVLETGCMTAGDLRRAMALSRVLDFYYNSRPLQKVFRKFLSVRGTGFLNEFLDYLLSMDVIDRPLSLERRGILIFGFCEVNYPAFLSDISFAWVQAGLSLKRKPAERIVRVKDLDKFIEENSLVLQDIISGSPETDHRFYWLPADSGLASWTNLATDFKASSGATAPESAACGWIFGYSSRFQSPVPVFCAFAAECRENGD